MREHPRRREQRRRRLANESTDDREPNAHSDENSRVRDVAVGDVEKHEIIRKQSETCRPCSTEYYDRRAALECNPAYVQAIHNEVYYTTMTILRPQTSR